MSDKESKRIFFDTNMLLYAHDIDAGVRYALASDLVLRAWDGQCTPVISVQVLQELAVNLKRKGLGIERIREVVEDYSTWRVIDNSLELFHSGFGIMKRYTISLWDAMIVAAAQFARADELWTEDSSSGQWYGKVQAINPFVEYSER
jgi:predicted nucleic acid-binding protein